jgi:hypothetical protein
MRSKRPRPLNDKGRIQDLNCYSFNFIERDFITGPIIQFGSARAFVRGHGLRVFERRPAFWSPFFMGGKNCRRGNSVRRGKPQLSEGRLGSFFLSRRGTTNSIQLTLEPYRANAPRLFGAQQQKLADDSEDKGNADVIEGMEVQGFPFRRTAKCRAPRRHGESRRAASSSLRDRQCVAADPRAVARCTARRLRRDERCFRRFRPL